MPDQDLDEDDLPSPPTPQRVAERALALAAVSCRALTEADAHDPGAEKLRLNVIRWLDSLGISKELEPQESALLHTPLGNLDPKKIINGSWVAEGVATLSWALKRSPLPSIHQQCEPSETANNLGFLDERQNTCLNRPVLQTAEQIERWSDTYLTLHWRLRQFSTRPEVINFVSYADRCNWGPLRLDDLEIIDNDLAIDGVRLCELPKETLQSVVSITSERHRALNRLLGYEPLYSEVTTDT